MCAATTCQTIRRGVAPRSAACQLRDAASDVPDDSTRGGGASRGKRRFARRRKYNARGEVSRVAASSRRRARLRLVDARLRLTRRAAATTAQRHVRGWIAREAYLDVMCVTVVCQARRRGAVARRAFLNLRDAVVTCQRRRRARRRRRWSFARSAPRRGTTRRGASARANRAATIVQAAWRGAAGRRRAADLRDERDAARLAAKILHRRRANEETRKKAEARRREREEEETRRAAREETRRAAFEGVASARARDRRGGDARWRRFCSRSRRFVFSPLDARTRSGDDDSGALARLATPVEYAVTVWATETCQAARRRVLERRRLDRRVDAERRRRLERLERDWFVRAAPAATTIQARWRGFFAAKFPRTRADYVGFARRCARLARARRKTRVFA